MSILNVIKKVFMICEEYNKTVDDIDLVDGLLLVKLTNGVKFHLYHRFMTVEQIEDMTISACKRSK